MTLFRSAPTRQSEAASTDKLIRLFQSETAEIDNAAEPERAHSVLLVAAAMFAILVVLAILMPVDRVVESTGGQVVTADPTIVLQAFDQSLIKTLDVKAGDRVKGGQLLATLDPTIAAADANALRLQVASDDAQIARCEAELAQKPYDPGPSAAQYAALQKGYYLQRKA
jgi:membrane fusion protein, hemolysin D